MTEPRTYTHTQTHKDGENEIVDFTVTVREQLGRDVGNSQYIRLTLRDHQKKLLGLKEKDTLPDIFWENIAIIANVIVQTVRVTSVMEAVPFNVPRYTDSTETITAFYDGLLDASAHYLTAFTTALAKVRETPDPLLIGAKDDAPSTDVFDSALAEAMS